MLFRSKHILSLLALSLSIAHAGNWPQWRGPNQDGSSEETNLPEKFSKTENVKWAADLPGLSASVPVVWGDSLFITAPVPAEEKFVGLCIDAKTGKGVWTFATKSRVESSPAVAGNRVFIGSNDGRLYVLDAATGKKLWEYEAEIGRAHV